MTWREAAVQHAMDALPREACGLLVATPAGQVYWPCRNLATDQDEFILHPEDYADADLAGEVLAIVHSHPHAPALPSDPDRAACNASGMPWHIVSVPAVAWERLEPNAGIIEP